MSSPDTSQGGVTTAVERESAVIVLATDLDLSVAMGGFFAVGKPTHALGADLEGEAVLGAAQGKGHAQTRVGTAVFALTQG